MHKIYRSVLLIFFTSSISMIVAVSAPLVVHADTRITSGYITNGATWTATGSPYLLDADIAVPTGKTLTVEAGAVIKNDPNLGYAPGFFVGGILNVNGTRDKPVSFSGIYNLNIYYATATIVRANISTVKGVLVDHSTATISSSTITGAVDGIYVTAGNARIVGSRLTGNDYGVYVDPVVPVYLSGYSDPDDEVDVGPIIPSSVTISNSSFSGNRLADIKSAEKTSTTQAAYNWWGSNKAPVTVIGQVNFTPWLDHDPTIEPTSTPCCSSVLFIPGLEGSWLYRDEPSLFGNAPIIGGTSTNTLWAPNRNDDVRKLFLDENGSSTDSTIYSGQPIGNIFGLYSVYGSFMKFMDGLVKDGNISEWKSFGYDWRKPIAEVVAGVEKKATTTESLVAVAMDIASRSRTGKVTIVAHSNGGLVAEYLVKALADAGQANIIDGVISVATPYLGTPSALSALLHGDHQEIADGLILNSSVARQLATNMSSAYSLLPSRGYFSRILDPVITPAATLALVSAPLSPINSHASMFDFIANQPLKGNSLLASAGDAIQSVLANFSWPANIYRWSIVGWNIDTPKSLVYVNKERCLKVFWFNFGCSTVLEHYDTMTAMGDGTVVAPSAAYGGNSTTSVASIDLAAASHVESKNIDHANILESSTTQATIKSILVSNPSSGGSSSGGSLPKGVPMAGVSLGEPAYSKEPVRLVVNVDAQADLSVHDSAGNHTGVVASPAGVDDDVVTAYEENIPGSHLSSTAEGSTTNTSISLPDNGQQYTVGVNGGSFGSFTLNIDQMQGTTTLSHSEFTDIPMTPSSTATTTIQVVPMATSSDESVSSTSISTITVDIDGDGTTDLAASSTSPTVPVVGTNGVSVYTPVNDQTATSTAGSVEAFKKYLKKFCGDN